MMGAGWRVGRIAVPLFIAFGLAVTPARALMNWPDLLGRPMPAATLRVPYGADPLQFADLWLPPGQGPHPLVIMIHGGCWRSDVAAASIMNYAAEDLRRHGIAVWNIEYRGIDRPGGGYPGSFNDVARAAEAVRGPAKTYHLALGRVVVVGHSAGGHLALWLAAQGGIGPSSPLHRERPLPISIAFSLGGLPDLEAAETPPGDTCGVDSVARLVGQPGRRGSAAFADTSPAVMPPPPGRVVLVNASLDPIAPPAFAAAYVKRLAARGPAPQSHLVPDEGHVELIAPGSRSWAVERSLIEGALAGH